MAFGQRGPLGWAVPALLLIGIGALAAYFFISGEDGDRALSITQIVVALVDIVGAFWLAARVGAGADGYYTVSLGARIVLWGGVAVMLLVAWGLWYTYNKAAIEASPMSAAAVANGASVTWQPSATGVDRDRLRFTPVLRNADPAGLCVPEATLTATLISSGSPRDEETAATGHRIELDLGPGGDARQVRLIVGAPQGCRMSIQITEPEFVS